MSTIEKLRQQLEAANKRRDYAAEDREHARRHMTSVFGNEYIEAQKEYMELSRDFRKYNNAVSAAKSRYLNAIKLFNDGVASEGTHVVADPYVLVGTQTQTPHESDADDDGDDDNSTDSASATASDPAEAAAATTTTAPQTPSRAPTDTAAAAAAVYTAIWEPQPLKAVCAADRVAMETHQALRQLHKTLYDRYVVTLESRRWVTGRTLSNGEAAAVEQLKSRRRDLMKTIKLRQLNCKTAAARKAALENAGAVATRSVAAPKRSAVKSAAAAAAAAPQAKRSRNSAFPHRCRHASDEIDTAAAADIRAGPSLAQQQMPMQVQVPQLDLIAALACTFCGRSPANNVTRLDCAYGYSASNLIPECMNCALARGDCNGPRYIAHCTLVAYRHNGVQIDHAAAPPPPPPPTQLRIAPDQWRQQLIAQFQQQQQQQQQSPTPTQLRASLDGRSTLSMWPASMSAPSSVAAAAADSALPPASSSSSSSSSSPPSSTGLTAATAPVF